MNIQNEVESFLNKARLILFVASEGERKDRKDFALINFIYSEEDMEFFKVNKNHENVYEYFSDGTFKFLFNIRENKIQSMTIINIENADSINLHNTMSESFYDFEDKIKEDEIIYLSLVFTDKKSWNYHFSAMGREPVKINGYSLVYI